MWGGWYPSVQAAPFQGEASRVMFPVGQRAKVDGMSETARCFYTSHRNSLAIFDSELKMATLIGQRLTGQPLEGSAAEGSALGYSAG